MGHTIAEKDKLLSRVRLLKRQLAEMETGFREEIEPSDLLQLVAGSRAQINGLMSEVLEDHLRVHVLQESGAVPERAQAAAEDLIAVVHAYMGR